MKNITEMAFVPTKTQFKARMTSVKAWELPKQKSALAPEHVWTNADMDPVPIEHQTWSMWTWMAYWATDTINLGTWQTASSIIAVGLSWREAIPAVGLFTFSNKEILNCGWFMRIRLMFHRSRLDAFVLLFPWF